MRERVADLAQRHQRERRRQLDLRREGCAASAFQGQFASTLTFSLV
jgi:hypothetical protein